MIAIRTATIDDVNDISYLGSVTFDQAFGHLFSDKKDLMEYLDRTFSLEKIKNSIVRPNNMYWIVFDKKLPIGYAKLQLHSPSSFIDSQDVCKLQKIYFLDDYISKGIGGKLQKLIFEAGLASKQEYLWLSVLKENEKAVNFYKRNNYKIIGEHLFSIGKENFEFWVMKVNLKRN